jgi:uncharacterized protein involved in exopolysaccharide biosynthesis
VKEERTIDLGNVYASVWRARWTILVFTLGFAGLGIVYALTARQWFRSDVVMYLTDSKSLPSSLGQLGGLASLAGINLNASSTSRTPIAVLKSKDFARDFIQARSLLPVLMADSRRSATGVTTKHDEEDAPDIRDAVRFFNLKVRAVTEDSKTGLVTLSVVWRDAETAAEWANAMVHDVNQRLRNQALAEAERNIAYLKSEMTATSVASLQQSIGKVLESEMEKALLARGSDEYAFKVIDKATPSKERYSPRRKLVVIGAALCGLFVSIVLVLIREWLRLGRRRGVAAAV